MGLVFSNVGNNFVEIKIILNPCRKITQNGLFFFWNEPVPFLIVIIKQFIHISRPQSWKSSADLISALCESRTGPYETLEIYYCNYIIHWQFIREYFGLLWLCLEANVYWKVASFGQARKANVQNYVTNMLHGGLIKYQRDLSLGTQVITFSL